MVPPRRRPVDGPAGSLVQHVGRRARHRRPFWSPAATAHLARDRAQDRRSSTSGSCSARLIGSERLAWAFAPPDSAGDPGPHGGWPCSLRDGRDQPPAGGGPRPDTPVPPSPTTVGASRGVGSPRPSGSRLRGARVRVPYRQQGAAWQRLCPRIQRSRLTPRSGGPPRAFGRLSEHECRSGHRGIDTPDP